jgi:LmbE family N-acetylglucosaminyl deacetylase
MPLNKLMIVAHPDDETLFGGGELIKNKGEYKVVVLDYGNHLIRHKEFLCAMEKLSVTKWEHWDGELFKSSTAYNESVLIPRLERVLNEKNWEKVVTHNQGGEYGHYRHIGTHNVLARLCPEKLWVFSTCKDKKPLSNDVKALKGKVLRECYSSQEQVLRWFNWECETIEKFM